MPLGRLRPDDWEDSRRIDISTHDPSKPDGRIPTDREQVPVGQATGYYVDLGGGRNSLVVPLEGDVLQLEGHNDVSREELIAVASGFSEAVSDGHALSIDRWYDGWSIDEE